MKSFSSSVISRYSICVTLLSYTDIPASIDKSGKKFAPKAPVRRAGAAPTASGPARASVDRQATSQTPQTSQPAQSAQPATDNAPVPTPPASDVTDAQAATNATPPTVTTETRSPESTSTSVSAKPQSTPSTAATSISIPTPKRKASVSAPAPTPVPIERPSTNQSPPKTSNRTDAGAIAIPTPISKPSSVPAAKSPQQVPPREQRQSSPGAATPIDSPTVEADDSTEARPSKRLKTSETAVPAPRPRKTPSQRRQSVAEPESTPAPLPTPPNTQLSAPEEDGVVRGDSDAVPPTEKRAPKTGRPRKKRTTENGTTDTGTRPTRERRPRPRMKREPTPEGSEMIEIAPAVVKMSDLCKDLRTGKKSKREVELQNLELAEAERKQKEREERETTSEPVKKNVENGSPSEDPDNTPKKQAGPVMRIVNGEIVLDATSLHVDRHADAAREAGQLEDVVENPLTRKINQATYGKRTKTESWDEEMTDLFYRGLRMFGTDFMMISKLFPGRSRRQIKLKFNNEERRDPERIKETLLGPSEIIDIATYSEMTNTVYDDPRAIQRELDEEKKRIEDQHAKEKQAQEELLRNPTGAADPGNEKGNGQKTKRKKSAVAKTVEGGTEEVLGSIDDFPMHT
ncbi:transcription factor TFIIIB component, putative [Paecilomyces variotii No. 5]|uniref:Transcription factor TFIIIB component, putative n=1 Tax=Byssochlamys spectabilis (strain No. 5 / NBRC 109023) TaxID=1356009 RepID=V5F6U0_BYSSN|nr:transcription factor TFIIIB component, putative [Paecilomyces variotii No. 5]